MNMRLLVAILVLAVLVAGCADRTSNVLRIDSAFATLKPDGQPAQERILVLRHRWDKEFVGMNGTAVYRLELPTSVSSAPRAALIERAGNQVTVTLDGVSVGLPGPWDRLGADAAKMPHLIAVPSTAFVLEIHTRVQALRDGGLWPVLVGPRDELMSRFLILRTIDQVAPTIYAASLMLVGALAAGLWMRQRVPLYGCFSLAAFAGSLRHIDKTMLEIPLPWPVWGGLLAVAYGLQLVLIGRFVVLIAGRRPDWVERLIDIMTAVVPILAALSFALMQRWLWTMALWLVMVMGLVCFVVLISAAFAGRRVETYFVAAAGAVLLVAGLHDLLMVREAVVGSSRDPLVQHALFFFVLLLGGIVVQRYSASVTEVRLLSQSLADRLAQREAQLTDAFESLRVQREQQAALQERQRIMRDIHDGVGAHLVGLLSLVRHQPDRWLLEPPVSAALDELRMAVDSLQPVHGDLATVLATLRYRLQPRLQAAGIKVIWDVSRLPPMANLPPHAVLQVQRILLEAFTNVIKHAKASSVTVRSQHVEGDDPTVSLELCDDGIGIDENISSAGQGLASMRIRAKTIGALLRIEPCTSGGTSLILQWALPRTAVSKGMS